ncbi:MAG: glycosyltransferase family 39 protein [Bacteroidota bacterium]
MEHSMAAQRAKWLYFFIGVAVLVNFTGLFVTIIGPDGALYASIAKTMALKNDFVNLFAEGRDWLDKPHFPFWVTAISFKLFGMSTWAYKLPAIIFTMIAAIYTYRLALLIYNKEIALWSALILLTAQHIFISNTDVRAEPYLTGLIIASVYHYFRAQNGKWFWHLMFGSALAACAVMTKGIFALIPLGGAIAGSLLIMKDWKMLFNFRWLLAAIMIFIFIIPELLCLYLQFDIHPEKLVFGQHNISGVKFFFWDSQFGRFFNTGPIKKAGGDPSFFMHTSLWAFLPWSILFWIGIVDFFRTKHKRLRQADWICFAGTALTMLILSVSKFQLPHYIIIIFPFFAVITARYICELKSATAISRIRLTQSVIVGILIVLGIAVQYLFAAKISYPTYIWFLLIIALTVYVARISRDRFSIFFVTCGTMFILNIYFNLAYYPSLVKYQADSEAAMWLNTNNPKNLTIVKEVNNYAYAIDFYAEAPVYDYHPGDESELPAKPYILYAESAKIKEMLNNGVAMDRIKSFGSYRITRMKLKFLNSSTRKLALDSAEIVLIK